MLHQRSPAVPRLGWPSSGPGRRACTARPGGTTRAPGRCCPPPCSRSRRGSPPAWDPELAWEVGRATGREIRALHDEHPQISLNVWAPVVNLLRDPRWGRNEEGYSEDPLLTALLGTAFGRGLSGQGCRGRSGTAMARGAGTCSPRPPSSTSSGYNNEDFRDLTSSALRAAGAARVRPAAVQRADRGGAATGVMPSYNLVNGRPAHVSPLLALIREWTDEELLTCSDAWAPSNLVRTSTTSTTTRRRSPPRCGPAWTASPTTTATATSPPRRSPTALERGLITMDDVDRAVRRKLLIRLRLGEFDPGGGPFASRLASCAPPTHRELAWRAARRAAVLLAQRAACCPLAGQPAERSPSSARSPTPSTRTGTARRCPTGSRSPTGSPRPARPSPCTRAPTGSAPTSATSTSSTGAATSSRCARHRHSAGTAVPHGYRDGSSRSPRTSRTAGRPRDVQLHTGARRRGAA